MMVVERRPGRTAVAVLVLDRSTVMMVSMVERAAPDKIGEAMLAVKPTLHLAELEKMKESVASAAPCYPRPSPLPEPRFVSRSR